mmetsp:Transcript_105111/g.208949  ORF Transcript_105111/g.208949 Transcript_105111/m.208949 type:complete len:367 (+) Transcript_105111:98-1198(+)
MFHQISWVVLEVVNSVSVRRVQRACELWKGIQTLPEVRWRRTQRKVVRIIADEGVDAALIHRVAVGHCHVTACEWPEDRALVRQAKVHAKDCTPTGEREHEVLRTVQHAGVLELACRLQADQQPVPRRNLLDDAMRTTCAVLRGSVLGRRHNHDVRPLATRDDVFVIGTRGLRIIALLRCKVNVICTDGAIRVRHGGCQTNVQHQGLGSDFRQGWASDVRRDVLLRSTGEQVSGHGLAQTAVVVKVLAAQAILVDKPHLRQVISALQLLLPQVNRHGQCGHELLHEALHLTLHPHNLSPGPGHVLAQQLLSLASDDATVTVYIMGFLKLVWAGVGRRKEEHGRSFGLCIHEPDQHLLQVIAEAATL